MNTEYWIGVCLNIWCELFCFQELHYLKISQINVTSGVLENVSFVFTQLMLQNFVYIKMFGPCVYLFICFIVATAIRPLISSHIVAVIFWIYSKYSGHCSGAWWTLNSPRCILDFICNLIIYNMLIIESNFIHVWCVCVCLINAHVIIFYNPLLWS